MWRGDRLCPIQVGDQLAQMIGIVFGVAEDDVAMDADPAPEYAALVAVVEVQPSRVVAAYLALFGFLVSGCLGILDRSMISPFGCVGGVRLVSLPVFLTTLGKDFGVVFGAISTALLSIAGAAFFWGKWHSLWSSAQDRGLGAAVTLTGHCCSAV